MKLMLDLKLARIIPSCVASFVESYEVIASQYHLPEVITKVLGI
jgi:hypothetical protein